MLSALWSKNARFRGGSVVNCERSRSAHAAKEINTLIGTSVERVESGARIVDGAGKTMEGIVTQVKRVSDLIAEIRLSKAEQRAVASESLKQQATQLAEAMNVFR